MMEKNASGWVFACCLIFPPNFSFDQLVSDANIQKILAPIVGWLKFDETVVVVSPSEISANSSFGFVNTKIVQMQIGPGLSFKATISLANFSIFKKVRNWFGQPVVTITGSVSPNQFFLQTTFGENLIKPFGIDEFQIGGIFFFMQCTKGLANPEAIDIGVGATLQLKLLNDTITFKGSFFVQPSTESFGASFTLEPPGWPTPFGLQTIYIDSFTLSFALDPDLVPTVFQFVTGPNGFRIGKNTATATLGAANINVQVAQLQSMFIEAHVQKLTFVLLYENLLDIDLPSALKTVDMGFENLQIIIDPSKFHFVFTATYQFLNLTANINAQIQLAQSPRYAQISGSINPFSFHLGTIPILELIQAELNINTRTPGKILDISGKVNFMHMYLQDLLPMKFPFILHEALENSVWR
jgi:hypothetical protein